MGITRRVRTARGGSTQMNLRGFGGTRQAPHRSTPWRLVILVVALVLIAAACGADDEDAADSSEEASFDAAGSDASSDGGEDAEFETEGDADTEIEATDDQAMEDEEAMEEGESVSEPSSAESPLQPGETEGDSDALGAGGTRVTPTAADLGRKLIFTAFVNVEVEDVAVASSEATSIIEGMGGFLFGQNTTGGSQASSELIFKVLPDDFNLALERLGSVGELRNQSVTTDDVTERIVDLSSRIEVADLGVARLRAALEGAPTLEDYAEIERLLLSRETELELMRGQLRTLQDRVDLATITLVLTQDRVQNGIELRISTYRDHDGGQSCPGQQLNSVEAKSEVTVCFDVINVGDQTLTNIVLTDSVLEIDAETELLEIFGSLDELAPGQSALVAFEVNPERTLRMRTRVSGVPTDGVSSTQAGPTVSTQVNYDLQTFEPDTDPGFSDGFSVAVSILNGLWIALRWMLGFILPLLILLPFIWLAWKGVQALMSRRPAKSTPAPYQAGPGSAPPPPPGPGTTGPSAPGDGDGLDPSGSGPTESGDPVGSDA